MLAASVRTARTARRHDGRLSNIVFMGMGEPLANYNRVLGGRSPHHRTAAERLRHLGAFGDRVDGRVWPRRSASWPTNGSASRWRCRCTLPTTNCATRWCPVNSRWKVSEALDAARYYADATGRRVSIEYALIRDVNDQPWRADLLGKRLHGALGPLVHVNLIPLNPTPGSEWDASPKAAEREFVKRVRERGVSCTVRDTRGREIAAACGQLAAQA